MPRLRSVTKKLLYAAFLIIVTFAGLELGVRVVMGDQLLLLPLEQDFWRQDDELGWDLVANFDGYFDKGISKGRVSVDGDGNRRNAGQNTFNREWPTVLFIGDSATASLEVDNEHTVPALLESGLRSSGLEYNVVNLGVRGYGTDQSVLKAIRFTGKYDPVAIIYIYDNNDDFDNNALRIPFKAYGKGVFIKRQEDTGFEGIHFDRKYADAEAGLVLLDRDCRAIIHEFQLSDKSVLGAKLARGSRVSVPTSMAVLFCPVSAACIAETQPGAPKCPATSTPTPIFKPIRSTGTRGSSPPIATRGRCALVAVTISRRRCLFCWQSCVKAPGPSKSMLSHFPMSRPWSGWTTGSTLPPPRCSRPC